MPSISVRCILARAGILLLLTLQMGCGNFMAHRLVQAPNSYPTWFAPEARVILDINGRLLTNFPASEVIVGPPTAKLHYRVIPPANYDLRLTTTNWFDRSHEHFQFNFKASFPGTTNAWTAHPRGTVILLHGYGLAKFAMAPWALQLAQDGWRTVILDLRGHGRSTGNRIFFGLKETTDLSYLLDHLDRDASPPGPVVAMGESYGAALALRWKSVEPRIKEVIAIAPYASISNAVLNIANDYAAWVPKSFIRSGLKRLPKLLSVPPSELDTTAPLVNTSPPICALFIVGEKDKITTPGDVQTLYKLADPSSKLISIKGATHESVTYHFETLIPPIQEWLNK